MRNVVIRKDSQEIMLHIQGSFVPLLTMFEEWSSGVGKPTFSEMKGRRLTLDKRQL